MVHGVLIHQMRYAVGLVISLVLNVVYKVCFKDLQVEMSCQQLDVDIFWGSEERAKVENGFTNVLWAYLFLVAWFQHISSTEAGIKVSVLPSSVSLSMCTYLLIILLYVLLNIGNCG